MLYRIDDREKFHEVVRPLYFDDIEELCLDIVPDTPLGLFFFESMERLASFCHQHPRFHIISCHGRVILNTCVPGATLHMLADGSCDRRLIYDPDGEVDAVFYKSLYAAFKSRRPNLTRSA